MSFIPEVPKTIHKMVTRQNAIYHIVMEVSFRGPDLQDISQSSNDQRYNLRTLIVRMHERNVDVGRLLTRGTIVNNREGRIDSQTAGMANIQYQIEGDTYAATIVEVKPTETYDCPELAEKRIDDPEFGFTTNQIMGFLQNGLEYSAHNRGYTDISWRIMKVNPRSPIMRRPLGPFIAAGLKIASKGFAKEVGKKAAKEVVKKGSKAVFGKIPVAGLVLGSFFALRRLGQGDFGGAALEMAGGVASTLPGPGTVASIAIDGALLVKDLQE